MNREEFTASSIALLRSAVGWQSAIARRLGVNVRTVQRWIAEDATPDWVDGKFAELVGARAAAGAWPRDEWLIGDAAGRDGKRREYVAHLVAPRFVARVVAVDDDGLPEPDEEPADILTGVVFSGDQYLLCEIDWIDEPEPGRIAQLLDAAAEAVDASAEE